MSGLIHEKLDIKILILYAMRRLPCPADSGMLFEICQCDSGIGYFDFAECLTELVDTGHVKEDDEIYSITEKGIRDARAVDSSLPYSVRRAADTQIQKADAELSRMAMVSATSADTDGGVNVRLTLNDDKGRLIDLTLFCADEKQARSIKRNFRHNAEKIYMQITEVLS